MNNDKNLVAAKQGKGREVRYVARKFHLAATVVLAIMLALGKNGKYARGRKKIYKGIEDFKEQENKDIKNDD